jgi:hypothetical protein
MLPTLSALVILIITTTVYASARDPRREPRVDVERGELRGLDKTTHAVVLRTAAGDEALRLTSATILREGAHVIQSGDLWKFVGHYAKARVLLSNGQPVLDNMIISPEHVTHGRLVSYDSRSRRLVLDTGQEQLAMTLTPSSWVLSTPSLIDADQLQRFVGHTAKVTTSMTDGHVISVWVKRKEVGQ